MKNLVLGLAVVAALFTSSEALAHKGHGKHGKKPGIHKPGRGAHYRDRRGNRNARRAQRRAMMQKKGIMRLGKVVLGEDTAKKTINLKACKVSKNKPVYALKLKVKGEAVQIDKLKVVFQNGQKQILNVKDEFRPKESSRWIDLKGQKRCIKKIVVVGDVNTFGYTPAAKAKVVMLGKFK